MEKRQFNPTLVYPQENSNYTSPGIFIEENPLIKPDLISLLEKELGYPFTVIRLDLPFCLHLEDGIYPVRLNGELNLVYNQKLQRKEIPYFGGEATNVEMFKDPKGLFRYSCFEIYFKGQYLLTDEKLIHGIIRQMVYALELSSLREFSLKILPNIEGKILSTEERLKLKQRSLVVLRDRAMQKIKLIPPDKLKEVYSELRFLIYFKHVRKIINRFISVYRMITKSFYLPNFRRSDIAFLSVTDFVQAGETKRQLESRLVNPITFLSADRSIEEHQIIWEALDKEIPISLETEMVISAHRYILEENYSLAVIEAFSGFEILLEQCLLRRLISNGMNAKDAKDYLNRNGDNWRVSVRVNTLFKTLVGIDLSKNPIYNRWDSAKKLREDIVHSGKRDISESEARVAVEAITNMMDEIKKYIV